jgi:hypothetical protein
LETQDDHAQENSAKHVRTCNGSSPPASPAWNFFSNFLHLFPHDAAVHTNAAELRTQIRSFEFTVYTRTFEMSGASNNKHKLKFEYIFLNNPVYI